jgi:hypothetical protein
MGQRSKSGHYCLGICLSWLILCSAALGDGGSPSASQQVALGWAANSNSMIAGYYLYYGTTSGVYTTKINAGTNTQCTVGGLVAGLTNYFTTTSYDSAGDESSYGPEVSYIVPGILTVTQDSTNTVMRVKFPVAAGYSYQLQASSNLNAWSNVWLTQTQSTNEWLEYDEPCTNTLSAKFYRLVVY